jgi:hypothetical protein
LAVMMVPSISNSIIACEAPIPCNVATRRSFSASDLTFAVTTLQVSIGPM